MTTAILVTVIVMLALYDLFIAIRRGYTATISYVILQASLKYPIIPFTAGVITGHILWPQ